VDLPYFSESHGLLAAKRLGSSRSAETVDLTQEGALVSHRVKYSHPPDGSAHFSQDGKIHTRIWNQSTALAHINGHMFTVMFNDVSKFKIAREKELQESLEKRAWLTLPFDSTSPGTIKVVGRWYTRPEFRRRFRSLAKDKRIGPELRFRDSDQERQMVAIAPPRSHPANRSILVVEVLSVGEFSGPNDPFLLFFGGFSPSIPGDRSAPFGFLAALYPASDFADLSKFMPSIDFQLTGKTGLDETADE
jgi:hypothetical protein